MATEQNPAQLSGPEASLALYRMAIGHYVSRALCLAVKLKLADLLNDGPRHYNELAKATETNASALSRVMRLLASFGVFEEREPGNFALTPLAQNLRSGVPGSMRASVMLFAGVGIQDSWKELEYCVRTGQPAFRKSDPDADPFTLMAKDPEAAAVFDEAMATFAPLTASAVAAAYDFSPLGSVIDIGGGNGALLLGILKAYPKLRGIVFDQPRVAESAKSKIAAAEMASRCEAVGGDFFESVPVGADAYLMKHVIHDWEDAKAVRILKNCRRAMGKDGRVLIVEGVYPARIDQSIQSQGAAANNVNMLVVSGGRQRSEAEFHALYEAAGFRLTRIVPTIARVSVIEGAPS